MKPKLLQDWIASGLAPEKFPAIPDDPYLHREFLTNLVGELTGLPTEELEKIIGCLPGILGDRLRTDQIVKAIADVYINFPHNLRRILLGELAVDLLIIDEKWTECLPWLDSLLESAYDAELTDELSIIYNYRGVCHYRLARYPEAQDDLTESLRLADEIDSDRRRARARINLGLVFKETGMLVDAAGHYKAALKLAREIGDDRAVWACYLNIGNIYKELRRWDDGKRALERAIDLAGELGDVREQIRGRLNLGVLFLDEGQDLDEAARIFKTVVEDACKSGASQLASIARSNLALTLIRQDHPVESLKHSSVSLEDAISDRDPEGMWRARANIARAHRKLGEFDKAEEYFIAALADFDTLRRDQVSDRERSEFQRNLRNLQAEYIEFSLESCGTEMAFARLARSKGRALQQARESGNEPIIESTMDDRELLSGIQLALANRPGSIILDYFLHGDRMRIFACDKNSITVHDVKLSDLELQDLVRKLTTEINLFVASEEYRNAQWGVDTAPPDSLVKLGRLLIEPVQDRIADVEHLIIVPQGVINHIPFLALVDQNHRYLVETRSISILPASDFLAHPGKPGMGVPENVVVIQGSEIDLEWTNLEIDALRDLFGKGFSFFDPGEIDRETGLADLGKILSDADVVHFTGHAEFDRSDPFSSALILDGGVRLSVTDLMSGGIDLGKTSLVTLSACETGMGAVLSGDEVIGIARAFLAAGAGAVIVSLWAVSDEATAKLIPAFYREWLSHHPPPIALRNAVLKMIEEVRVHPYFFAPFNIIGIL